MLKAALDEQIAREPAKRREPVSFPWRRAGMVAAAVLVLFVTTVMAIPSTRAEVLSWLGIISRPQDYLTADPSARPSIPVLDNMIEAAQPEDTQVKVNAIDRTGTDVTEDDMKQLLAIDKEGWKKELETISEHYAKFDRLPAELEAQRKALEERFSK